jgi:prepilin-type N-terminal cleavage/methylation domain-containing protein
MVKRHAGDDAGMTLVEIVIVLALLSVSLATVYTVVFAVMKSTSSNMDQASAAHDLAYTMELLGKTVSESRLRYADDQRLFMLVQTGGSSYQMNEVYVTTGTVVAGDRGNLVWERWDTDASGTAPVGSGHTVVVMSDRNANLYTSPPTPLFVYYTSPSDTSALAPSAKSASPDVSLAAFVGTLPGGYPLTSIGRVQIHLVSAVAGSAKDDTRDVTLRLRN